MYCIAAGLIFVFFYFTVQVGDLSIDLLPDILGHALIAFNAWKLRDKSWSFSNALWLAPVMGVYVTLAHLLAPTGLLGLGISIVEVGGTVWLLKLLVKGVADLEEVEKRPLRHAALERWRFLTTIAYVAVFACDVALQFIPGIAFFSLTVVLLWFVLCIIFTVSFFRTASRYKNGDKNGKSGKKYIRGPLPPHIDN